MQSFRRHGFGPWVRKIPLEEEMTTHSSILSVIIPWTKEPSGLQSMGSERVGHDWVTEHSTIQVSCMTFISARYLLHHCSARQERIMVIGNRPSTRWLSVSPICAYTAIKTYYLYVPVPSFIKQKSRSLHLHLKQVGYYCEDNVESTKTSIRQLAHWKCVHLKWYVSRSYEHKTSRKSTKLIGRISIPPKGNQNALPLRVLKVSITACQFHENI